MTRRGRSPSASRRSSRASHPTMIHAGVYSGVLHYLKAVEALKAPHDGAAVTAKMKELPTDDALFGKGKIRADGRKIHPAYLFEVKKPGEMQGSVGLLQDPRDDPCRGSVPAARQGRLPVGQVTTPAMPATLSPRIGERVLPRSPSHRELTMFELLGIPPQALFGQLLLGLINGSFYALLSLGLAVIFGMLNIINFAHGAHLHDGRIRGLFPAAVPRGWLLAGARDRAAGDRTVRHDHRALDAAVAIQARPPLRAAADLRPRPDHPGAVPEPVRLVGTALPDSGSAPGRAATRLHVPADLPRLGDRLLVRRLPREPGS